MPLDATKILLFGFVGLLALGAACVGLFAISRIAVRSDRAMSRFTANLAQRVNELSLGVITVVVAVTVAVLLVEAALRLTTRPDNPPGFTQKHPTRGYALRPGYKGYTYDAPLEINDDGIRGSNRAVVMDAAALRIVVLGDSMTYGLGVAIEQTYPRVLERMLQSERDAPVQVFNLGVPSYNTMDQALFLEETFDLYKPHLVILQYMVNNDAVFKPRPSPPSGFRSSQWWRFLRDVPTRSFALAWTSHKIKQLLYNIQTEDAPPLELLRSGVARRMQTEYGPNAKGWMEVQRAIGRIQRFLEKRNTPFVFAMNVNHMQLSAQAREILEPQIDLISETVRELGVSPALVIDDAFVGLAGRESELWVRPYDAHWNVLGHSLVAEFLFRHLSTNPQLVARSQ